MMLAMKTEKILAKLLVSSTRRKLIKIFFSTPDDIFYVRQLVRFTSEEINSVRRELQNLASVNLIKSERRGNRLYYWANQKSSLFPDLLTLACKISHLGLSLAYFKNKSAPVSLLLYSYNFAVNKSSTQNDIDLIVVGQISPQKIESHLKKEEQFRGREINYMVMNKKELQLRMSKKDPFIVNFFLNCPLFIIGSPQEMLNV